MIVGRFFRGRQLLITIVILILASILCSLGAWQWDRYNQRMALNRRIDARMVDPPIALDPAAIDPVALEYRRVVLQGSFDNTQSVLLRNRSHAGTTGYHLLTPLKLKQSGAYILVDRGWVPFTIAAAEALKAYPSSGEVSIEGVIRRSEAGNAGPADPPFSAERPRLDAWFRVDLERIAQQAGYPLLPIFVEAQPGAEPSNTPPIPEATTDLGEGSNLSYTIQWYSFALILIVGYVLLILRGPRNRVGSVQH